MSVDEPAVWQPIEPGALLRRYHSGEHEAVWAEMLAVGPYIRQPPYYEDALAVARETMRRARHNVELLITRLDRLGYEFWNEEIHFAERRGETPAARIPDHLRDPKVFQPFDLEQRDLIHALAHEHGILPLSLWAWIEEVGQVDLTGYHPALCFMEDMDGFPGIYADPLMIYPDAPWPWIREQQSLPEGVREAKRIPDVFVSFNDTGKAGLAGLNQVDDTIAIPNSQADAILKGERHKTTLVEYLRICFRWGGFPGWERYEKRPEKELAFLAEGLLAL